MWEANHVWLIFVLVVLWTGFPTASPPIMSTLYVPLTAAAVGIILRGAGFAFRKSVEELRLQRAFGVTFAASSLLTPFFLGTVAGAVASGRVPGRTTPIDPFDSWIHPTSLLGGTLAVVTCAYLAAVFLAADAAQHGRRRARRPLPHVRHRRGSRDRDRGARRDLRPQGGRARPVRRAHRDEASRSSCSRAWVVSARSLLLARRSYRLARVATVAAVVAVVWGWAAGQYPDVLVGELTIEDAAGSRATLTAMLASLAVGGALVAPALGALLVLHSRGELEDPHG